MAAKKKETIQYSKRLATAVTIAWVMFRLVAMIASLLQPSVADSMVNMQAGADNVMIMNIGLYTGNSIGEKGILAFFNRKKDTLVNEKETEKDEDENG